MKLILGSKSPRRAEILKMAGYDFDIVVSDVDENVIEDNPEKKVLEIAKKKARAINVDGDAIILCADTIVVTKNDIILGKPKDKMDAKKMIELINDDYHYVYTAFVIIDTFNNREYSSVVKAKVNVVYLKENEIEEYINTNEPYDKAGAYAIQGYFGKYISSIEGDYYNVMGLPICAINQILKKLL
ncbi:MAG: septum formation protein Maf [Bacilli bacterium]|nr:septum formation protein Maf [Bacilli bacterium]